MNGYQNAMDLFILGDLFCRYCRSESGMTSAVVNGMDSEKAIKRGRNQVPQLVSFLPFVCETFALSYNTAPTRNPSSSGDFFGLIFWQRKDNDACVLYLYRVQ